MFLEMPTFDFIDIESVAAKGVVIQPHPSVSAFRSLSLNSAHINMLRPIASST